MENIRRVTTYSEFITKMVLVFIVSGQTVQKKDTVVSILKITMS